MCHERWIPCLNWSSSFPPFSSRLRLSPSCPSACSSVPEFFRLLNFKEMTSWGVGLSPVLGLYIRLLLPSKLTTSEAGIQDRTEFTHHGILKLNLNLKSFTTRSILLLTKWQYLCFNLSFFCMSPVWPLFISHESDSRHLKAYLLTLGKISTGYPGLQQHMTNLYSVYHFSSSYFTVRVCCSPGIWLELRQGEVNSVGGKERTAHVEQQLSIHLIFSSTTNLTLSFSNEVGKSLTPLSLQ